MTTATMTRRLAALEREVKAANPQQCCVCTPIQKGGPQQYHKQVAPGVYVSSHGYPDTKLARHVCYTDIDLLRAWLALPEQSCDRPNTIYTITTQAQYEAFVAKIDSEI